MQAAFRSFCETLERLIEKEDTAEVPLQVHEEFIELCNDRLPGPGFSQFINGYLDALHQNGPRAGSSMFHENGFTKISLWKSREGCQLRLHIWPKGRFADSRTHNHRWNLSSYVVYGSLTAINYAVQETGFGLTKLSRLYDADSTGVKAVQTVGQRSVSPSAAYEVSQGSGHYLTHDVLHRVKKHSPDLAISLMLSGRAQKEYSLVSDIALGHRPQKRQFLSAPEIAVELEKLVSLFSR